MGGLTADEEKEFRDLKRYLLTYHHLGLKGYNPHKERYNELWDKLVKHTAPLLKKFNDEFRAMDEN
jgi:hypothetical protein